MALVPLLVLARDVAGDPRPVRAGALWGMLAGAVFFAPLLEWLRLVDWVGLGLLVALQALFVGAFVAGLAAWGDRRGAAVAAAVWWVGLEALRGTVPFGGFPWGLLGYTQAGGGPALPVARLLGVLGVSLVLAGVAVSVHAAVRLGLAGWRAARDGARAPGAADSARDGARAPGEVAFAAARTPLLALVALLALPVLVPTPAADAGGERLDVAAIQGFDIEGSTGRDLPRSLVIADKMLEVTDRAVAAGGVPDLTVWPENALDGDLATNAELRARVAAADDLLDGGPLLSGMIVDGPGAGTWMNTLVLVSDGEVTDRYVKQRPVPFGEYIPFRWLVDWYPPIRQLRPTDAVHGSTSGVFDAAGTRVGSVICFESIFPGLVHTQVREGAEVLVVATNNSSFGRGAASDQHLAFSRLRAVETGRWVVHAALSGISAVVDPDGGVHQRTGLYSQAIVRTDVPLVSLTTLATRLGQAPAWVAMGASALGLAWLIVTRRRERTGRMAATERRG